MQHQTCLLNLQRVDTITLSFFFTCLLNLKRVDIIMLRIFFISICETPTPAPQECVCVFTTQKVVL